MTPVGGNENEYQILEGDIYWKDFVFINDVIMRAWYNLCTTTSGTVVDVTETGKIDYENNVLNMNLTTPAPYQMVGADWQWIRIV